MRKKGIKRTDYEQQDLDLVKRIKENGYPAKATKGPHKQLTNALITLEPDVLPLLTVRKMYPKGIVGELKGFLNNADTHQKLQKYGCNFWGAWAGSSIDYAKLLHCFNGVNQLERCIASLKKPDSSRKVVISLWDPASDTLQPPCVMHYQWLKRGDYLDMIWSQRSVDVMIGLASDMMSAWLFNQVMAREVGLKPGKVYMQLGAVHIYDAHMPQVEVLLTRKPQAKPEFELNFTSLKEWDLQITDYNPRDAIKFELKV